MLEVDQKVVENDLGHLLLLHVHLLSIDFLHAFASLKGRWACRLLFLNLRSNMKNLVDNFQQVIRAPLLVISHDVFENAVHFDDNVHLHELGQLNFSGLNYCSDNFNRKSIELRMVNLKILENNIDELELVEDYNKGTVSFNDHGKQFETEKWHWVRVRQN